MPPFTPHPDSAMALVAYAHDLHSRRLETTAPTVHEVAAAPNARIANLPGGSIWLIVGPKGSKTIAAVRKAVNSGKYEQLGPLGVAAQKAFMAALKARGDGSLRSVPVLAEMRYGSKTVAQGLFVAPGTDATLTVLPYTGGKLTPSKFALAQYLTDVRAKALDAVVVIRKPDLTPLEQDILRKVPAASSEVHIGTGDVAAWPGVVAAVVVLVTGWVVGTYLADRAKQDMQREREKQQRDAEREANNNVNVANDQANDNNNQVDVANDQAADENQAVADDENGGRWGRWADRIDSRALTRLSPEMSARALLAARASLVARKLVR